MIKVLLVDFFCSSEWPRYTNIRVQFRVIPFFKLFIENFPEVTLKFDQIFFIYLFIFFWDKVLELVNWRGVINKNLVSFMHENYYENWVWKKV